MKIKIILLIVFVLLAIGCVEQSADVTANVEQTQPESSLDEKSIINYSFGWVEKHEEGVTLDASILVQPSATKEEVVQLLEYFKDTVTEGYVATTILVYNNTASAQKPSSEYDPTDPYLVAQLNKYTREKGELKEGKIFFYQNGELV